MPTPASSINIQIDADLERRANEALAQVGLSMSDAVRMFLHQVATDQRFPWDLRVPNQTTRDAMKECDDIIAHHQARFITAEQLFADLEKSGKE